jgi:hypothetical protein
MKPPIFKFAKPDKINAKNGNFEKNRFGTN